MDRLQTIRAFVRVVGEGSFAAAARSLDIDQAVVTRLVADLERHLGVKLLERTTRSMRLTEAGEIFLARSRDILSDIEEAEAQVSQSHQAMIGRVRMALPTSFGMDAVALRMANLLAMYPDLVVEISMLDRPVDPVAEGYDVVVMDALHGVSATAVARPLVNSPFVLCASAAYLSAKGTPQHPRDLAGHRCVAQQTAGEAGASQESWTLEHPDGARETVQLPVAMRANNFGLSLEAVCLGMGIGRFTARMLGDSIDSGRLVQLLPEWQSGSRSYNLVYPSRRLIPRRVRYVIDSIVEQGREANWLPS